MLSPCDPKTPQEAGYATWEHLFAAWSAAPDLRTCPARRDGAHGMMWVERKFCRKKCRRYDGSQDRHLWEAARA